MAPAAAGSQPVGDVGGHVQRQTSAEADRRDDPQRLVDMAEGLLHAEREEDDAEDHRHVEVRVQVEREPRAIGTVRVGDPGLRHVDDPVEVRPPQGRSDDHPEHGGRDPGRIQRQPGRADADRDDRLSEGDDDDQPVTLDEVRRRETPAPPAADERTEVVDRQGGDPQPDLHRPINEAGDQQQRRPDDGAGREPEDGGEQLRIVATGDREEDDMENADDEIRDGEDQGLFPERHRRRQGHDQHRGRRGEHGQAYGALFGVEGVGQPGIGRPGPPQRGQQQPAPQEAFPGLVRGKESGHLGDREDEDEVEEQLERGDPLFALDRSDVHRRL